MNAHAEVAAATRTLLAIVTAHLDHDDETASELTVELGLKDLQTLVAVASVRLAEAWKLLALDEGRDATEFVRDLALTAARYEGKP